jgi:NADH-quinone oxidoreductase subunit N
LCIAQGGFLVAAIAAVAHSQDGLPALLLSCVILGSASIAAFAVVVALAVDGGRGSAPNLTKLETGRPFLVVLLVLAMFSLAGLPPLPGFVAKVRIMEACVDAGYGWLLPIGVLVTLLSCAACVRAVRGVSLRRLIGQGDFELRGASQIALLVGFLVVAEAVLADPLLALAQNVHALGG